MKFIKFLIFLLVLIGISASIYWLITHKPPVSPSITVKVADNQQNQSNKEQTLSQEPTKTASEQTSNQEGPQNIVTLPPTEVSIYQISADQKSSLDLLGTVKAQNQVKIYSQTTGQLAKVNFAPGDYVKKSDVLFELKGANGSEHQSQTQLKIAQTNFDIAKRALQNTKNGNNSALRLAELQLQSALAQADAASVDLQTFDQNIAGSRNNLSILQDSLEATRAKNSLDLEKTQKAIDDLYDAISKLNDQKYRLQNSITIQSDNQTTTQSGTQTADQKIALAEIEKKLEELYTQFENAKISYKTLLEASELTENQLLTQIKQAQNQVKVLELNQESLEEKLGLSDGIADSVSLAEENISAAAVRNDVALSQAQAQFDLARLNLELAKNQVGNLKVVAPSSGIIDKINVSSGDLITPQTALTQIIDTQNFELEVAVGVEDAEKIKLKDLAQVKIGGKFIEVPIKNISPIADQNSKLVIVTLSLPKINFKANQTLTARLVVYPNIKSSSNPGHYYIPLDAVIIGSEEQYVFVAEADAATGEIQARKKVVKLGEISGDKVQILEGIQKSDQVIVQGAKQLIDGQKINLAQSQNN